jgi:hypothetical protein
MTPIEIPLSKSKLSLMLIGAIAFVALGFWLLSYQPTSGDPPWMNRPVCVSAGTLSIAFFGLCSVLAVKKLFSTLPGLIISDEGITDNSSGLSAGPIPWKDILSVQTTTAVNQRFILIMISNPQVQMDRQTSSLKRKAMAVNYRTYGTPICISANGLKCNFNELYGLLTESVIRYKNSNLAGA